MAKKRNPPACGPTSSLPCEAGAGSPAPPDMLGVVLDNVREELSLVDCNRTILYVNRPFAERFGCEPRRLVGRKCHDVFHGRKSPCDDCPCRAAFEHEGLKRPPGPDGPGRDCHRGRALVTGEAVIQTSERDTAQGRRTFECRTYPIFGPDGSPAFALHSVRDVTEQREMERALRRQREQLGRMLREVRRAGRRNDALNAQLLQAEKMASLGQMASMMAHDLDTPLSTIMGYAQVLGSCADEEERRRHLRKIAEQAARCHQIIRRTLDFARQPRAQAGPVDLNAVVRQVTTLLEHPIRAKRAMLEHDLAEPAPVLRGDEHSLTQLCFNLVRNALDAVQPNGRVVVRTRRRDSGSVRLEVEDNGHGLTPEAMERLFTPFFTTKPPGQGTGLGLTICRSIARAHGGTIRAENREGGGARFVVELPAGDANTAARADAVG